MEITEIRIAVPFRGYLLNPFDGQEHSRELGVRNKNQSVRAPVGEQRTVM